MRHESLTCVDQRADGGGEARIPRCIDETVPWEMGQGYNRGESPEARAGRYGRDVASGHKLLLRAHYQRIGALPLDYIPNAEFQRVTRAEEKALLGPAPAPPKPLPRVPPPAGLPPYLTSLYEVPLLTREQEFHLFRKMNYLKYKASQLFARLDPEKPDGRLFDRIEHLYQQSIAVKNDIILANLRLVVAIARRYAGRAEPLFEVISDGNMALIRAVEKFDCARGFKFSTYATWAIVRTFAQTIPMEYRYHSRFLTGADDAFHTLWDERIDPQAAATAHTQRQEQIARILQHLDDRERQIIRCRYGLGPGSEPMHLLEVGRAFGRHEGAGPAAPNPGFSQAPPGSRRRRARRARRGMRNCPSRAMRRFLSSS